MKTSSTSPAQEWQKPDWETFSARAVNFAGRLLEKHRLKSVCVNRLDEFSNRFTQAKTEREINALVLEVGMALKDDTLYYDGEWW